MSITPIEHTSSLRIGTIEYVAPDEIKVTLDLEAPDGIAANAGVPRAFPRINNYVIFPSEAGYVVGQIEWIAVESSPFPKRKGFKDYGLVDLPFPLRKMRVNPLGILKVDEHDSYQFQRGVQTFPSIGEPALIPTDRQLIAIIESGQNRRVKIGVSPLAANADVCIDPDRLFGRHLAVLGNTGSGKSCSVAGLIQWSLAVTKKGEDNPNARFIILDPNGEYSRVFEKVGRIFIVDKPDEPLQVPLWFWNSAEWCSFTQAKPGAQVPLLRRALRSMRNEEFSTSSDVNTIIKRFLGSIHISIIQEQNIGNPWGSFPRPKNFFEKIKRWHASLESFKSQLENDTRLDDLIMLISNYISPRETKYPTYEATHQEIQDIREAIQNAYQGFGGTQEDLLPKNEDMPIKFSGKVFADFLEIIAQESGAEQYVEFLLARIRTMLSDTRMKSIIGDDIDITLDKWLEEYIGKNKAENGCVSVIDLSLVPAEIIHIVISVIARIIFEALQRYKKHEKKSLPTVIVMEEAHTFIKRYREEVDFQSAATICCQIFEKIAREGRKFGLGLVLSSQRPSELSSTVLSQCNSFLLHRISNDRDQEIVNKLVPDNFRGLLRELPSLPSQNAILLGWASELPILVRMNDLYIEERPHSEDPDFWDVWNGINAQGEEVQRDVDWKKIADDWQHKDTVEN